MPDKIESSWLTIGEVAERSGVNTSALRFYESEGLIESTRSKGGQRRFQRDVLRRIAFIGAAQRVGLTLGEINMALTSLPHSRTPNAADWSSLSSGWRPRIDAEIEHLTRLRDQLSSCIGCGCLSLDACALYNSGDSAARYGGGPRYLMGDPPGPAV